MSQAALTTTAYADVIDAIKNGTYTQVNVLYLAVVAEMTRLGLTADPTKTVTGSTNAGDWQFDAGSIIDWMKRVAATDAAAIVQIIAIHATCVTRLAS